MALVAGDQHMQPGEGKTGFLMKSDPGQFAAGEAQTRTGIELSGRDNPLFPGPGAPAENAVALAAILPESAAVDVAVTARAGGLGALVDLGAVAGATLRLGVSTDERHAPGAVVGFLIKQLVPARVGVAALACGLPQPIGHGAFVWLVVTAIAGLVLQTAK